MKQVSYSELSRVFLKLGAVGFGGPVALISLMEKEFCAARKWVGPREFQETFVFCKLLPGPVAYQMAVWVGSHVRGPLGGIVAGICFLIPGLVLIIGLAALYTQFTHLSSFQVFMEGMRAGAIVVIAESVYRMWRPHWKEAEAWLFLVAGAVLMYFFPRWEPLIILACGFSTVLGKQLAGKKSLLSVSLLPQLFWLHFKAGAFVFGTGLAIIPFLEAEVVSHYGWLSHEAFLDGIAFGQVTPGPVTITSAFVGYRVSGLSGALAAAGGMYLPGLILILGILPFIQKQSQKRSWLAHFQNGAIPAVIGCIVTATLLLAKSSVENSLAVLTLVGAILMWRFTGLPSWAILLLCGPLRWVIGLIGGG